MYLPTKNKVKMILSSLKHVLENNERNKHQLITFRNSKVV